MAILASLTVLSSLAGVAAPAGAQSAKTAAFPDGNWQGSAIGGGTISTATVYGATGAEVKFEMTVADQEVTDGTLVTRGSTGSQTPGGGAQAEFQGTFGMSGTASEIDFDGSTHFVGSVTASGLTVPLDYSAGGYGLFSPKYATCSRVSGDFAFYGRKIQEFSGVNTDVMADFIAVRVTGADADNVIAEYQKVAEDINATLAAVESGEAAGTVEDLFALIQQVNKVLSRIANLQACGALPVGFEEGLADGYFADAFNQLVLALLAKADQLSVAQLLTVLYAGFSTGAFGGASPSPAAGEAISQFLDILSARIEEALADGDVDSLVAILAAAEQFGLGDLAAKADAAIDQAVGS